MNGRKKEFLEIVRRKGKEVIRGKKKKNKPERGTAGKTGDKEHGIGS